MLLKLLLAAFLFAHGAMHLSYLSRPRPATGTGPQWPFALDRSWLLTPFAVDAALTKVIGLALVAGTLAAFTLAAASVLGVLPQALWAPAAAVGAASSIALLVVFFHPWLVLGVAIDLVILAVALVARWTPEGLGS